MSAEYNDRKAAYHEAGHAVIALYHNFPVRTVSIDMAGGGTTTLAWWHQFVMRFSEAKYTVPYIEYLFAGRAGEMFVRESTDAHDGFVHDLRRAEYLRMLYMIPREEFDAMWCRVSDWINHRSELIQLIGERLLREQKISGRELKLMMNSFHEANPHFAKLTRD